MIEKGQTVKVHYEGFLKDTGQLFDSSYIKNNPISFKIGANEVIKGFEEGILDMNKGDKKEIIIEPQDGYGPYDEENIHEIDESKITSENGESPKIGDMISGSANGEKVTVIIKDIKEKDGKTIYVIDGNHLLAGKTLTFNVELLEIN